MLHWYAIDVDKNLQWTKLVEKFLFVSEVAAGLCIQIIPSRWGGQYVTHYPALVCQLRMMKDTLHCDREADISNLYKIPSEYCYIKK